LISASPEYLAAAAANRNGGKPIWLLEIDQWPRSFTSRSTGVAGQSAWISAVDSCQQSIDILNGSSSLGDINITVLDYRRQFTAEFAGAVLEGRKATFKVGYPGLDPAYWPVLFSGIVNKLGTTNDGSCYVFNIQDMNRVNQQVIYLLGDDGQPCDSDHPKTVVGNPLDILLQILRDQVGLADHDVDIAGIEAARDQLYGGMEMQFTITSPPEAKNFIEQELLKPLGGYGYTNNLGQYTVGFLQPLGQPAAVMTLDRNLLTAIPVIDQADLVNTLSYRFDSDGSKFWAETVQIFAESAELYGQWGEAASTQGQTVIESQGVRSGFQGFALARLVAKAIFARYGSKNPITSVSALWPAALLDPGDYVMLVHPLAPNRATGGMGINQLMQVVGRTRNHDSCTVDLDLTDASRVHAYGSLRVAPDGTPGWTGASDYQKNRYLYIGGPDGKQSDGTLNGKLG
jgi:hypothetical protein